jgi:hypothetical protein
MKTIEDDVIVVELQAAPWLVVITQRALEVVETACVSVSEWELLSNQLL